MANTGYVSIGHLTRLMSDENKIQVLRDFCKVLTQEISDSYINKDSLIYRFDLFFSNVKPTVESFTKVSRKLLIQRINRQVILIEIDANSHQLNQKVNAYFHKIEKFKNNNSSIHLHHLARNLTSYTENVQCSQLSITSYIEISR